MNYRIPFNKPFIIGKELDYIAQSVESGHTSGDGEFTRKCQQLMQQRFDARQVLLTTSCTHALEMAAILCEFKEGDEVILPSYTFTSTANAFALHGARLRFADIRPDTLNLDESKLEELITDKTRAIVCVHYAGVACAMDAISALAEKHGLIVIEDAAQGVNAKYKGAYLGTIGDLGAYSFHETKNFICGEGGAFVINDERFAERAEVIREKGTNRSQFFRGQVDKYTWVDVGSSYLPSDILAAFLYAQLENMAVIRIKRRKIFEQYSQMLQALVAEGQLRLPVIPDQCESNYHMFYVLVSDVEVRDALIAHLGKAGILAVFHYMPLHTSPMGMKMGCRTGMLPVTENVCERVLRLPFYYGMSEEEVSGVVREITRFFDGRG